MRIDDGPLRSERIPLTHKHTSIGIAYIECSNIFIIDTQGVSWHHLRASIAGAASINEICAGVQCICSINVLHFHIFVSFRFSIIRPGKCARSTLSRCANKCGLVLVCAIRRKRLFYYYYLCHQTVSSVYLPSFSNHPIPNPIKSGKRKCLQKLISKSMSERCLCRILIGTL